MWQSADALSVKTLLISDVRIAEPNSGKRLCSNPLTRPGRQAEKDARGPARDRRLESTIAAEINPGPESSGGPLTSGPRLGLL